MKLIGEITEQQIIPGAPQIDPTAFPKRHAVRAVLLNSAGEVALLHVSARGYHKLPGGGVDDGETPAQALARELMEELGCKAQVTAEIGRIVEYWDQERQIQTSDCYLATQTGSMQQPAFTAEEQAHGFTVVWAPDIDTAIAILQADQPNTYDGQHIKPRDILFLQAAKQLLA